MLWASAIFAQAPHGNTLTITYTADPNTDTPTGYAIWKVAAVNGTCPAFPSPLPAPYALSGSATYTDTAVSAGQINCYAASAYGMIPTAPPTYVFSALSAGVQCFSPFTLSGATSLKGVSK